MLKKLRRACKNTAHLGVVCLSDQNLWELCHIIVCVFEPMRLWHGHQSVVLRSSDACCRWHTEQAAGAGIKVMQELVRRMRTSAPLRHLGAAERRSAPGCLPATLCS